MCAKGSVAWAELTDNRTAAVGEHHRAASLDDGWRLRGHDIRAEIEFARRDADHRDHKRRSKTDHHNFEVGGAVCGVQRRIHATPEHFERQRNTVFWDTALIPTYKTPPCG